MTNTATPQDSVPDVFTVMGNFGAAVHLGKPSRHFADSVVTACNGRTLTGFGGMAPATAVTCKRCRKLVTA